MAIMLSAGTSTAEKDFSSYIPQISTTIVGMVGTAVKGPIDKLTFISNVSQFIDTFGNPSSTSYSGLAALQYLEKGNQLWFVRVAGATAAFATATINDSAATPAPFLRFSANSKGDWANATLKVTVTDVNFPNKTFDLTVEYNGSKVEYFDNLSWDATSTSYVEEVVNNKSRYLTVDDLQNGSGVGMTTGSTATFSGGLSGISDATKTNVVGTTGGLQLFADPDAVSINLLCAPGYSDPEVINAMLTICEGRGDALAICDTPFGLSSSQVVDWHNGAGSYNDHQAFNSSYGAMYWSWLQVFDPYSGKNRWVPPSGLVAAVFAYNDSVAQPWFAPAGLRRGKMSTPIALEHSPNRGERDLLYGNKNAINPIVNFAQDGITVWGQRTLQRSPSASDRVNVRRLLLMSRKAVALSTAYFTFEQNDEFTWTEWRDMIDPFFQNMKSSRGLNDYLIQMDATTVTPYHQDSGQMPGRIYLKPTRTSEFIPIDFVLSSSGATFS